MIVAPTGAHLPVELGDFPSSVTPPPLASVPFALLTSPSPHLRLLLSLSGSNPPFCRHLSTPPLQPHLQNAFFVSNQHVQPRALEGASGGGTPAAYEWSAVREAGEGSGWM